MRKYYQLLLILISIASLSTLLMYRREYLKLRYVLEVLSYFGTPQIGGGGGDCLVLNETAVGNRKHRHMFSTPTPTWTKVGQHFVYSAFWEYEGDKSHARALAVGPPSAFTNFECHIWFDEGDAFYSEMGKFGYSIKYANQDASNANKIKKYLNMYQLYCEPVGTAVPGIPQTLILIYTEDNERVKVIIPIHKSYDASNRYAKDMAVCVKADVAGVAKSRMIEFITYHHSVGISEFLVYDNGLRNSFLLAIQSLTEYKGFANTFSILNWNFPYNNNNHNGFEVESLAMEMDCLARASGKVRTLAVLDWDEYIVPRHHRLVPSMLNNLSTTSRVPVEFELQMIICCIDLKDDKRAEKSWPLVLRKTQCMPVDNKNPLIVNFPKVGFEPSKQKIAASVGAVYVYRPCSGLRTITKYDTVMTQFLGEFMTSNLLKLWKSGSLNNFSQQV